MKRYEQIPHTADIAVRVYGKDPRDLFANAAYALFDVIADIEGLEKSVSVDIEAKGSNPEEVLVSWLDELLYNFYSKGIIFCDFEIASLDDKLLVAKASGRHLGENRNRLKTEIKGITYHNLEIKESETGYTVEIIFDV